MKCIYCILAALLFISDVKTQNLETSTLSDPPHKNSNITIGQCFDVLVLSENIFFNFLRVYGFGSFLQVHLDLLGLSLILIYCSSYCRYHGDYVFYCLLT